MDSAQENMTMAKRTYFSRSLRALALSAAFVVPSYGLPAVAKVRLFDPTSKQWLSFELDEVADTDDGVVDGSDDGDDDSGDDDSGGQSGPGGGDDGSGGGDDGSGGGDDGSGGGDGT